MHAKLEREITSEEKSYIALWFTETEFSIKSGNFSVFVRRELCVSAIPKLTSYWNNSVSIMWFAGSIKLLLLLKIWRYKPNFC